MSCQLAQASDRIVCITCGRQSSLSSTPACNRLPLALRIANILQTDHARAIGGWLLCTVLICALAWTVGVAVIGPAWAANGGLP